MGFLDKAKAAATDLAAKADTAITQASSNWSGAGGGNAEHLLRDYGLLTWREQHGQPVDAAEFARVREALQALDGEGRLRDLPLQTSPPPPPPSYQTPPPPGGAASPPPPGGQHDAPPSSGDLSSPPPSGGSPTPPPPPPPPPGF
ncbi:hypothetical protein [Ornithinimicrobium cryptoxanthini]|uniref:hypothetical protein n=1 Tax=Ornithinimicrobium cryptoxanthini TaxID=2934161 RepID=UPI002118F73B|nr:hypothetical protein [Ornithinimicrobium cryptoxanthini]